MKQLVNLSRGARWAVPAAVVVVVGGALGGTMISVASAAPSLPARTPAQLLASVAEQTSTPPLTGTVVETSSLGLPSLPGTGNPTSLSSLLTGSHTIRIWYSDPTHFRVSVPQSLSESDLIRNGGNAWLWESTDNTVTHLAIPTEAKVGHAKKVIHKPSSAPPMTPQQAADEILAKVGATTTVSSDTNVTVAGQAAYQLVLAPKSASSLIGQIRIAIDGANDVPLRLQVFAKGSQTAAVQIGFTSLSFVKPAAANFAFSPPAGATVKQETAGSDGARHAGGQSGERRLRGRQGLAGRGRPAQFGAVVRDGQPGHRERRQRSERGHRPGRRRAAQVRHPGQRLVGSRPPAEDQPDLDADDQQRPGPGRGGDPAGPVRRGGPAGPGPHLRAEDQVTDVRAGSPGPAGAPGATADPAAPGRDAARPAGTDTALAVSTTGLTKRFRGGQVAVDHIDLAVPRGSVYGFLGPNGSGKTTTIRMLLGLAFPTSGRAELLGVRMPEGTVRVLPHVGSLIEGPAFYPFLNGRDNLARSDAADRTADPRTAADRINGALDRVGLLAAAGKRYRNYSLGMKQRLAIAASLLTPRQLIILDEPTNGLDPQGTREVRTLIREIAADGITVFVSSHLLAEVEQVCSHVGVMRTGRLVFQGSLAELRRTGAARIRVETADPVAAAAVLQKLGLPEPLVAGDEVTAPLGDFAAEQICADLVHAGIGVRGLGVVSPSLEELFVGLTGEGYDVDG